MFKKARLGVLVLAGALTAIPMEEAMGGRNANLPLQTVYTCSIIRAGTVQRPIIYTFNTDGTFNYSSATTINSLVPGPVHDSGFQSRGGGRGQWTRTSTNTTRRSRRRRRNRRRRTTADRLCSRTAHTWRRQHHSASWRRPRDRATRSCNN